MLCRLEGEEKKYFFKGAYQHQIELTMYPKQLEAAEHVAIFAYYRGQLLLTKHKLRGIEWPGGKVEKGETPLQAAIRETVEETGAIISSIWCVGQYKVTDQHQSFMKNIYVASIDHIDSQLCSKIDTDGAILTSLNVKPTTHAGYSELMLDQVFEIVREVVLGYEPHSLGYN